MPPATSSGGEARLALGAGIGCYLIWGVVPLVFQHMGRLGLSPWEILAHRIVWSVPVAALFVLLAKQGGQLAAVLRNPRTLAWLALSSLLIAANWMAYIWAVNTGRVLESALGYYINPLVNMAAGALLFRERIDRLGQVAIGLAVVGVAIQTVALGHLPWLSLLLALSFGGYGVVRKQVAADAQTGFLVETLVCLLPAAAYVVWLQGQGGGHFGEPVPTAWMLAAGPVTAVPLVLFAWAARRMPLSAMGFLQFMAPTIAFGIGVAQGEPFTPLRALSFVFIWGGAAVFIWGAWHRSRTALKATQAAAQATAAE